MIDIKTWLQDQQKNSKLKRFDLELLLLDVLKVDRSWLFSHDDEALNAIQLQQLQRWVKEAEQGKPIAYILGYKAFWTLDLLVSPDTLIPRPETEQIVELALDLAEQPQTILDLGTGTGAIALALAKEIPDATILATDFSKAALAIAEQNGKRNHIKNIQFKSSDWFNGINNDQTFDLIVSNPPYIDPEDEHLEALTFEPITALTAERKGLKDLESIISEAHLHLNAEGTLMLEHGYEQGPAVQKLLSEVGYQNIKTHQDLAGHDRITVAQTLLKD